ncbi:uncharacterized protein LOC110821623 isoform X2 [Carica papaya]|uniref:uncharacterized protein LOC110821623 isoform X2 n=1 Tax=Carica papaya TaxID=3649 RepID=UPI000B8C7079|nr:uncharacterized protein LOC110821623 isoform X2 [Carica papaya]
MAEFVPSLPCTKLHIQGHWRVKEKGHVLPSSRLSMLQRKSCYGSCNNLWLSTWRMCNLSAPSVLSLKVSPSTRESSFKSSCLGCLADLDGIAASDLVPLADQVLLMASILLTYIAGVIPAQSSDFSVRKKIADENIVLASPTSPGSAVGNDCKVDLKYAWDAVKRKLLDSLDAIEHRTNLGSGIVKCEEHPAKPLLNLYAISEGPKLKLLWASFHHLEEEVNNISISYTVNMDDWKTVFCNIIRKSCQPACVAWLENKFFQENSNHNKAMLSMMIAKLNEEETGVQNIRKSGKEDLYSEFLHFHVFGSQRKDCWYDHSLFLSHGDSILEDLVITLADGIATSYLEIISVDGNMSNEINCMSLDICNLSTRALQRLRNEVALRWWLYQNMGAVVAMYEDRFDLLTLQSKLIEQPKRGDAESSSWWKKLTWRRSGPVSSPLSYIVMSHYSMPVKRTKELRALTGWRYYFSLFLELSDITMPLIRVVFDKVSGAISFFLVSLIGRSIGLVYTGIRQSLRWK